MNYFQPEQVAAIRETLKKESIKWKTLVHLPLITGVRRWEILGLKWDKVDFNGNPVHPDSVTDWLAKLSRRHSLPHINLYAFHHTMASMLYFNGLDSVSISKRLGHAQVSTTANIYAHIVDEADQRNG